MREKEMKEKLRIVKKNIHQDLSISPDGYLVGYLDAISDVELVLDGVHPRSRLWDKRG